MIASTSLRWFRPLGIALLLACKPAGASEVPLPSILDSAHETFASTSSDVRLTQHTLASPSEGYDLEFPTPEVVPFQPSPSLPRIDALEEEEEREFEGPTIRLLDPESPPPLLAYCHQVDRIGYHTERSSTTWLPGHDDQFGWVSLVSGGTLSATEPVGLVGGMNFHFLDGPVQTDMPPRLFDFLLGYQRREWIRPNVGWDFAFRVGAFSDFEGSAKEGIRFPSHLVTYWRVTPTTQAIAGVDYLDWDDLPLLPVFGLIWTPHDDFRLDLTFPRPRAALRIMETSSWIYLAGEPSGGTWAIERGNTTDDNVTYRDQRFLFGIEKVDADGSSNALELGYVFDRRLRYRSGVGDYSPRESLVVRLVGRF